MTTDQGDIELKLNNEKASCTVNSFVFLAQQKYFDDTKCHRLTTAGIFVLQNASANGLIGSLATRDFHGLPANWLETYVPGVLAVRADQMQALARQWMPLDKMTIVVVGDLATVEPQLRAMPELQGMPIERVDPFGK